MPPQLNRLFIIFGFLAIAFVTVRYVARPKSFYEFGHYRGDALKEATLKSPHYVPRAQCADCHDEEAKLNLAGPHSHVNCQVCHGPGDKHVDDPSTANITKPEPRSMCLRCHEERVSRPAKFPQINEKEHAEGKLCSACHTVHNPSEIK